MVIHTQIPEAPMFKRKVAEIKLVVLARRDET
jgi:hypothetical protein